MKLIAAATILSVTLAAGGADDLIKKDKEKLQGRWQVTAAESKGEKAPAKEIADMEIIFKGDLIQVKEAGEAEEKFSYKLDPGQKPKAIDLTFTKGINKGRTDRAIYELDGDHLKICIQANKDGPRPKEFATAKETDLSMVTLKRVK